MASLKKYVKDRMPEEVLDAIKFKRQMKLIRKRAAMSQAEIIDEIQRLFERRTGEILDYEHPVTFNQKIQWSKAYNAEREYGELADKFLVRAYVSSKIGTEYLTKLYGVWDSVKDVDFAILPEQFVIKATHGCGWNIVVPDKRDLNVRKARRMLSRWLQLNYAFISDFEMHYRYCQPRVIAEEYLSNGALADGSGDDLWDYKFWCFDGKCHYIQFLSNRSIGLDMAFFNTDWELQPFVYTYPRNERYVERPDNLDEMIHIAEKLAEGFPHVRVDFYRMNDGRIVFGEMTFTSMGGYCKWDPESANVELGNLFHLPL